MSNSGGNGSRGVGSKIPRVLHVVFGGGRRANGPPDSLCRGNERGNWASLSFFLAWSRAVCSTSTENHDSQTASAQYLNGAVCASNAGSSFPEAPSITYSARSGCFPQVALAAEGWKTKVKTGLVQLTGGNDDDSDGESDVVLGPLGVDVQGRSRSLAA